MEINTSFDKAFLQLQNGVNSASKAANEVLESVGADKGRNIEVVPDMEKADEEGAGGINVTV